MKEKEEKIRTSVTITQCLSLDTYKWSICISDFEIRVHTYIDICLLYRRRVDDDRYAGSPARWIASVITVMMSSGGAL